MTGDRAAWARYVGVTAERSKYGAVATEVGGIRFDSAKEAKRYGELRLLEKAGVITELEVHPKFPIDVVALYRDGRWTWRKGSDPPEVIWCGVYTADFRYRDGAGKVVIEDVKSWPTRTTAYRLRKRLVEAIHGVTITEVT